MIRSAEAIAVAPPRLGEYLLAQGVINSVQLSYALQKQAVEQRRLGELLIRHGLSEESDVAKGLAVQWHLEYVDADALPAPDPKVLSLFNRELCLNKGFLPLQRGDSALQVLLGNASPEDIRDIVHQRCGMRCQFVLGDFSRVTRRVRHSYYFLQNPVQQLLEREVRLLGSDVDNAHSPEKMLDFLLHLAVRERATDIHMAPSASSLHILFRIDGVLRPMLAMPPRLMRLLTFIKLTAEMDISEQRRPQDGSFATTILDMPFTVRISTLISESGERAVLRLLPERNELAGLTQLGFHDADVSELEGIFSRPAGLVLITGPTGSGKSTTLHAALRMQSLIERNVLTVEDPVEYLVPGAAQTRVNRRAGYDFSTALRHFLRHDPDVMLIGEIRDTETAQVAIEAAATGHLVLSTLHVSSAFGVVPRLRPLGLDAQTIADNLLAVVNQRLLRQNCSACSEPVPFTEAQRAWLNTEQRHGRRGVGCPQCGGTGYQGRLPVYEILRVDETLANAIADDAGREAIRTTAHESGFRGMVALARSRICLGQTTFEEVLRVVGEGPAA